MVDRPFFYDRNGEPIEMKDFGAKFADRSYQRLAADIVEPLWISTVWLGIDHDWSGEGPPLIFETMGFALKPDGNPNMGADIFQYRYATEAQARRGHALVVEAVHLLANRPGLTEGDIRALMPDNVPIEGDEP